MSLADLRALGRHHFHEMQTAMQILSHFAPHLVKRRNIANGPLFGDVVPPERLRSYSADLPILCDLLKTNRAMANYYTRELARGMLQTPSHTRLTSYLICRDPQWPVPVAEHSAALGR